MGNCSCKDGSIGGRCALYWGSISMRTRGLPLSKAQITPSGEKVSTNLTSMLKKPNSALVARPSGADIGCRMAWNALCMSELPSITAMVRPAGVATAASADATGASFSTSLSTSASTIFPASCCAIGRPPVTLVISPRIPTGRDRISAGRAAARHPHGTKKPYPCGAQ